MLSSVAALVGSTAVAADLPTRKAALVPPPAMLSWDGFYLGVNAGYGWTGANNVVGSALPGYSNLGALAAGANLSAATLASRHYRSRALPDSWPAARSATTSASVISCSVGNPT